MLRVVHIIYILVGTPRVAAGFQVASSRMGPHSVICGEAIVATTSESPFPFPI